MTATATNIDPNIATTKTSHNSGIKVIRRNKQATDFDPVKITTAITKAFLAVEGDNAADSNRIYNKAEELTIKVVDNLKRKVFNDVLQIEDIQDQVELALMRSGEQQVSRAYVLYREARNKERTQTLEEHPELVESEAVINVTMLDGTTKPLDTNAMTLLVNEACSGFDSVSASIIIERTHRNLFDGIKESDIIQSLLLAARTMIDVDTDYSFVSARLLLASLRTKALDFLNLKQVSTHLEMSESYGEYFKEYLNTAIELELLDPRLNSYDLDMLISNIKPERDLDFTYLGLQTLYDRYFIHNEDNIRFELPQMFFMRVAMGLAINEINREERTIEFYNLLSSFNFMSSTPTLFNSGTLRPQLSSCYLTTVPDSLGEIYNSIRDNALLSKYAGGLGNDWTPVRGMGSHIKGTNGKSQGVVPFLKVSNDTAVAVNQGGKRKGAVCAYLETWHIDIEDFLDLRKNTGDERRRTHDMNTANWIPDLFMERVVEEQDWTLFSPEETPDLHDLIGKEFEQAYVAYEKKAANGELKNTKTLKAIDLWRKMIGMLFETGHPWVTFKDPCNIRYTNQHQGVVHSSNLCTEITLHTNQHEVAVCNLGSVNLPQHIDENGLNHEKLKATITTAMRMLDNVIEYNYYSIPQARKSNLQHRPVGLGLMGFQDALYKLRINYSSEDAIKFADNSMEAISYYTIEASSNLAAERGSYSTFEGSLWSQGILPVDSIKKLAESRGEKYLQLDDSQTMDWDSLRSKVTTQGMRNSNTMAIAPTATISNICGVSQSIEPTYQNMFVKSNLSGEFTILNPYLVKDLKKIGLWDEVMVNDLKHFDGSLADIDRIPDELKQLYQTAFEMDSRWLIECAARRQKWIDQGQSLNIYMSEPSGKKLDNIYKLAWVRGLKTTYYLRSKSATGVEKSTEGRDFIKSDVTEESPQACSILDPDCDACQ